MKGNTIMKELKYQINYETLLATVEKYPEILASAKPVFEKVRDDVRYHLDNDEGSLIHGDLWSGKYVPSPFPNTKSH
jgi:hypothetical protein